MSPPTGSIDHVVAVHHALSALGAADPAADTAHYRARLFEVLRRAHDSGVHSLAGPLLPDVPDRTHAELEQEPRFALLAFADDTVGIGYYALPMELLHDEERALLREANGAVFGESCGLPAQHARGVLNVLARIGEQDLWSQLMADENELELPDEETLRELAGEWSWHAVSQSSELDRCFVSVVSLLRRR